MTSSTIRRNNRPLNNVLIYWLRFSSHLPLALLHGLGVVCGWLLWLLPNDQRRVAAINLGRCMPVLSTTERRRLLRRNLCESAKTLFELGPLWLRPGERVLAKIRAVEGEADWQQALSDNHHGGGLILTPHLGAWEVAGLYISKHYPLTAMYRPSRQGIVLDTLIKTARERLGGRCVPADASGVKAVFRALKRTEVVGILPDQDPAKESGLFAPFFGQPAFTMTLVSRLARKYPVPVFSIYAERLSWARGYRLRFERLPEAIASSNLETSVATLNQTLEQAVRRCPTQYLWSYKRFKTQPPQRGRFY